MNPEQRTIPYRADIEGLRGIAVALVVAYHAGFGFSGGYVGVDVFFVLSGYLITSILITEIARTGKVDLIAFYGRRIRRLLPGAAAVLWTTSVLSYFVFAPTEHPNLIASALAAGTYVSNAYFAAGSLDYLGAAGASNPYLHMWSLSLEEQFYVLWPVLLWIVARRSVQNGEGGGRFGAWIVVTTTLVLSLACSVVLTEARQPWAYFLPISRAWEFAIGGLVALLPREGSPIARYLHPAVGWAGLAMVLVAAWTLDATSPFPGSIALVPVIGSALVLAIGHVRPRAPLSPAAGVARVLEWPILRYLGSRSYAWYLWHWPVLVLAHTATGSSSPTLNAVAVGVALLLAEASTRWVENPLRQHPGLVATPRGTLLFGAALTLASALIPIGWFLRTSSVLDRPPFAELARLSADSSPLHADGCHVGFFERAPREDCVYGNLTNPTRTVVLFGDSHAAMWSSTVLALAERERWSVRTMTKSACPAANLRDHVEPRFRRSYVECAEWREASLQRIAELRPDLVITTSHLGYDVDAASWTEASRSTFERLVDHAGLVVHLADPPSPGVDTSTCLARAQWYPNLFRRDPCVVHASGTHRALLAAEAEAAAVTGVVIADMAGLVCGREPCEVRTDEESGALVKWYDDHHLTSTYAATLAEPLGRLIALAEAGR